MISRVKWLKTKRKISTCGTEHELISQLGLWPRWIFVDPKETKQGSNKVIKRGSAQHSIIITFWEKGEHAQHYVRLKRAATVCTTTASIEKKFRSNVATTKLLVLFSFYVVYFYEHEWLISLWLRLRWIWCNLWEY